jgi:hypothetical protein
MASSGERPDKLLKIRRIDVAAYDDDHQPYEGDRVDDDHHERETTAALLALNPLASAESEHSYR